MAPNLCFGPKSFFRPKSHDDYLVKDIFEKDLAHIGWVACWSVLRSAAGERNPSVKTGSRRVQAHSERWLFCCGSGTCCPWSGRWLTLFGLLFAPLFSGNVRTEEAYRSSSLSAVVWDSRFFDFPQSQPLSPFRGTGDGKTTNNGFFKKSSSDCCFTLRLL